MKVILPTLTGPVSPHPFKFPQMRELALVFKLSYPILAISNKIKIFYFSVDLTIPSADPSALLASTYPLGRE